MEKAELEKVYLPHKVEDQWISFWLEKNFFHPESGSGDSKPSYCVVIPPPNITGSLHLGHALNNTLQDILVRRKRMQGFKTLWLPGTDHAGIATQNVVERAIKSEGQTRETLGRKKFIERVWKWRNESGGKIIGQLKQLGASCDWDRERFTMDGGLSEAVREVFVRLYEEGLIYRGERLINWCPRCQTALSDIEVEHEEIKGKLYFIKYPLADEPHTFLTVATTRPETMLGDTAVAVHPDDPRYSRFIGKNVLLPLTRREIPIVGDPVLVDREFGTGGVKITPAHDFNDFEAGERHGLPRISILNEQGQIRPGLEQEGVDPEVLSDILHLNALKAREKVIHFLEARGQLEKVEAHSQAIGKCYRCKAVVEPFLSTQWFVAVQPLAAPAIKAVRNGKVRLIPKGWENNYFGWMENIKDWCISRQIWWGHQISAWYCSKCSQKDLIHTGADGTFLIGKDAKPVVSRTPPDRCPTCHGSDFIQDPDVLDTWFSSSLWPFSTLGWPAETPDLKAFYPTSALVTSFDILFFWVARMIMMGIKFMGTVPFQDVYIHALVRDAEGQKMSKSKGNVIDPLGVMEKYGTDALRFTLAAMASPGRDIKLSEQRIEGYRNFANKIWNAARFVLMNFPENSVDLSLKSDALADRWVEIRLQSCIASVNRQLDTYRFDEAANTLYQFIWHEYCDWYLELIKPRLSPESAMPDVSATHATMVRTFETLLRLLHPFMPFITEELWQKFPHRGESIVIAPYPQVGSISVEDEYYEGKMEEIIDIIKAIRAVRSELSIPPTHRIKAGFEAAGYLVRHGEADIRRLAGLSEFELGPDIAIPSKSIPISTSSGKGFVVVEDVYLEKEKARLEKKLKTIHAEFDKENKKFMDKEFQQKAPGEVKLNNELRRAELNEELVRLSEHYDRIKNMLGE